jgi:excinuclease ABC subunit B
LFTSATPADWEREHSNGLAEQVIRPTGLVDPQVEVRPTRNQIDDLLAEIRSRVSRRERVLVTTLTKRMAEDLTQYYQELGVRVRYLHSDIETLERIQILRGLRRGEFDVLVGINLLREGLDLPEVSLVAILDADKEGFLRSSGALIQTSGRAARNVNGRVVMYADTVTASMRTAIGEMDRRRQRQEAYNLEHGITPQSVVRRIDEVMASVYERDYLTPSLADDALPFATEEDLDRAVAERQATMKQAVASLDFERAAALRDEIKRLRAKGLGVSPGATGQD